MNDSPPLADTHMTPRALRAFNAVPGSAVSQGLTVAVVLLVLFFTGRVMTDGGAGSTAGDLRLALIHILMTSYSLFAYSCLLSATDKAIIDLEPVILRQESGAMESNTIALWSLPVAIVFGLLVYMYGTEITTIDSDPWDWAQTNYDSKWMRTIGPFFAIFTSCFLHAMIVQSSLLSRVSENIAGLDLLDLKPYQPLVVVGLSNALLVLGMASVLMLFLMEPGFGAFIGMVALMFAVYAWVGLMLPLRGIRRKIEQAKNQELDWCRQAMQSARSQLKAGAVPQPSLLEISAYKTEIECIRNWPFDNPTLIRFSLYLLIPLGSMFGGAFVERGLELFVF